MSERPTKYWIITAARDHVQWGVAGGFGQACHGKANPLRRMRQGDYVLYYSSKVSMTGREKCQAFTAIGQVKADTVYSFQMSEDFCPSRIDIDFFPAQEVSILPLIESLDFIENKTHWGYPFRWGLVEISAGDYDTIAQPMLHAQAH